MLNNFGRLLLILFQATEPDRSFFRCTFFILWLKKGIDGLILIRWGLCLEGRQEIFI